MRNISLEEASKLIRNENNGILQLTAWELVLPQKFNLIYMKNKKRYVFSNFYEDRLLYKKKYEPLGEVNKANYIEEIEKIIKNGIDVNEVSVEYLLSLIKEFTEFKKYEIKYIEL